MIADGAPEGPDGGNMFTGCVIEKDGTYYLFYQGQNSQNPLGTENIKLATSPDLIQCQKVPDFLLVPDGVHYNNQRVRDFRDPHVFWSEEEKCYWMLLCAQRAGDRAPVLGLAKSRDLLHWEQVDPLPMEPPLGGVPECPDVFKIGDTYYLLYSPGPSFTTTDYRYSKHLRGPYKLPDSPAIDTSVLYAAKRMWDGRRHVLTGWLRDLTGHTDRGGNMWGGTQSLAREAYANAPAACVSGPCPR